MMKWFIYLLWRSPAEIDVISNIDLPLFRKIYARWLSNVARTLYSFHKLIRGRRQNKQSSVGPDVHRDCVARQSTETLIPVDDIRSAATAAALTCDDIIQCE